MLFLAFYCSLMAIDRTVFFLTQQSVESLVVTIKTVPSVAALRQWGRSLWDVIVRIS